MSTRWIAASGMALAGILTAVMTNGCAGDQTSGPGSPAATARAAWAAWASGDLETARSLATQLTARPATADAGHAVLALAASVGGDYREAIAQRAKISPGYPRLDELDEPILCSYVHAGDLRGALAFARQRHLPDVDLKRLQLAISEPFSVQLQGVTVVPFTDDALTPYMPGMEATLNGRRTVVRLDTGGSFVHISASQAAEFGIKPVATETAFSSLTTGKIGHGAAPELRIAGAALRNVPVSVHYGTLGTGQIAKAFGLQLGPIIGTSVLEQFLTTVDGPGRRLILSPRGDAKARAQQLAMASAHAGKASVVPFLLWLDHYMLVQGRIAGRSARFFVDSGLVAATPNQGQANLLASHQKLAGWGAAQAQDQTFPVVPGTLSIGDARRDRPAACPVDEKVWQAFGDWGGIRIDALVSWGFFSHFTWTLDFDHHTYTLIEPQQSTGA